MTLDHYAPCPCGSGKKLKFCKCVDQPQEYEKIVKLIEGGQGVAAIDRINQLLAKTPNAAWLLAIKGELSLSLQEMDLFTETAKRFLKLKPDNPLALVMRSIAATLEDEPVETISRYLLSGLSEARDTIPGLALSAIEILVSALLAGGRKSMVGYWTDVLTALTSSDEGPTQETALNEPSINLVAKAPAKILDDPPKAPWKERLAEVLSLARTFRFAQAETKLRAILRDFPDKPGPLSHLLRAQCALLDQPGAVATARKLAQHQEVDLPDRAYFTAVALELEPQHAALQTERLIRYSEVDSVELIEQTMQQFDFVQRFDGQESEKIKKYYALQVADEVPAKHVYSIFNRAIGATSESADEEGHSIATSVGTVVLFGRQTDKPPRVLVSLSLFPDYRQIVQQVTDALQLGAEYAETQLAAVGGSYVDFLRRPKVVIGPENSALSIEDQGSELIHDFLNLPLQVLDNKSPLEAADDESLRVGLTGLLYHLEGEQIIVVNADVINEIYGRLNIERPQVQVDASDVSLKLPSILDLDRVDIDALNDSQLKGLFIRSMQMGAFRVLYRAARAVREREQLQADSQLQIAAMSSLLNVIPDVTELIEICEKLEATLASAKAMVGKVVIQRVSLLQAAGRVEEAQQALSEAVQKYPEDPYLMSFVQYALQQQGRPAESAAGGGDELAMRMAQQATAQPQPDADSGLVLPGQDSSGKSGESKLWLPGS